MSILKSLKDAKSREDIAHLLGYSAKALSYILYILPTGEKYKNFTIPKANGQLRQIDAPLEPLKSLQRRLANVLYACCDELEREQKRPALSHAFRKKRSIVTNAKRHRNRRYVLNLDLQDFFPTLNFGRVRGFFIKNQDFALTEAVATVIAQIACYDGVLPQGSPCSPIISDLLGHILDMRLVRLAKKHRATYSRYADDLTFSTNEKEFPSEIALLNADDPAIWELGEPLRSKIENAGFVVNPAKTRMQYRGSRQSVTGLTVNRKVNIRVEYYKLARSMCHALFMTGRYFRPTPVALVEPPAPDENAVAAPEVIAPAPTPPVLTDKLAPLGGILSHIHFVKDSTDHREDSEKRKTPTAARELYRQFLFYKSFIALKRPLLVCEGKTDNIYLRFAMRQQTAFHPRLGIVDDGKFKPAINLFGYTNKAHDILRLGGGTGDLKFLFLHYGSMLKHFRHRPFKHPVIVLVDNDKGAAPIFSIIKEIFSVDISLNTTTAFYHITENLYLIKVPELGNGKESCIEDLFEKSVLDKPLDGRKFNKSNTNSSASEYGKYDFAEKVIKPNYKTVKFDGFTLLLSRIVGVMDAYVPPIQD